MMQNSILDRSATRRSFSVLAATAIFTMAFSPSQALAATLWSTSSSHSDQGVRFTYPVWPRYRITRQSPHHHQS